MLGENIKIARKTRGLSQSELAERANKGRSVVSNIEKGIPIKTDSLIDLLWALGLEDQFINSISLENDEVGLRLAKESLLIEKNVVIDTTGEF